MEQMISGQMGQPAACMMENKSGLRVKPHAYGGQTAIFGIMSQASDVLAKIVREATTMRGIAAQILWITL
jgi:hypothetical protein